MKIETEEINLKVDGINLKGWFYKPQVKDKGSNDIKNTDEKPVLVLCHGIPGGKQQVKQEGENDGGYPALAYECVREGFSTFHFNFRGTRESQGNFDLKGWTRDLQAFLDYLDEKNYFRGRGYYLWGFSAGAAVSTWVTARDKRIKRAVLAACPWDFEELFPRGKEKEVLDTFRERGIIREETYPEDTEKWLLDIYEMSPKSHIDKISSTPLFLVHGSDDELISYSAAFNLYENTKAPGDLLILSNGKHQLRKDRRAVEICLEWLKGSTGKFFA